MSRCSWSSGQFTNSATTMKTLYKQLKALHRRHILLLFATCSVSCSTPLLQENRKTADKATEAGLIAEARDILTAHYVDPFFYDPSRDTTLYVLVDRLDPYSGYFSPQRKKRFD